MINQPPDRSPLYARVESALGERIAAGALAPGDRLPSEDELAEEFAVSRTTVRSAIQSLVQRGLVEIRRGRYQDAAAGAILRRRSSWILRTICGAAAVANRAVPASWTSLDFCAQNGRFALPRDNVADNIGEIFVELLLLTPL